MPKFFKTCLITHTFDGNKFSFSKNIQDQINCDILYDEVKINYIAFNPAQESDIIVNIYVPEFQQWLGTFYDSSKTWTASSYSINLEGRRVPHILTFKLVDNQDNTEFVSSNGDDIVIMLTFIKH